MSKNPKKNTPAWQLAKKALNPYASPLLLSCLQSIQKPLTVDFHWNPLLSSFVLSPQPKPPACLLSLLKTIAVPHEIFFQSPYQEKTQDLGCFHAKLIDQQPSHSKAQAMYPNGVPDFIKKEFLILTLSFPLILDENTVDQLTRYFITWSLAAYFNSEKTEIQSVLVEYTLCKSVMGNAFQENQQGTVLDLWPVVNFL